MNIFEKMSAVTNELQTVAKNLTVQQSAKSSYKAVSERDILDAVKPLECKYGIYSYPYSRKVLESQLLESENEYNGKVTRKTTLMTRIETVYRFVNIEKPEEYIETTTFAEGMDSQDKGSGKAMTYGDKYALMKAYKISTGDDPDANASMPTEYSRRPDDAFFDDSYKCVDCGKSFEPFEWKGKAYTAKEAFEIAARKSKDGKARCKSCREKIENEN